MTFDKQLFGGLFLILIGIGCLANQFLLKNYGNHNLIGGLIGIVAGIGLIKNRKSLR